MPEVCPVKIDIPQLLLHLRSKVTEGPERVNKGAGEKFAFKLWRKTMLSTTLYAFSNVLGKFAQRLVVRNGVIGKVGRLAAWFTPLRAWTEGRDLRPIEPVSFRNRWRNELKNR